MFFTTWSFYAFGFALLKPVITAYMTKQHGVWTARWTDSSMTGATVMGFEQMLLGSVYYFGSADWQTNPNFVVNSPVRRVILGGNTWGDFTTGAGFTQQRYARFLGGVAKGLAETVMLVILAYAFGFFNNMDATKNFDDYFGTTWNAGGIFLYIWFLGRYWAMSSYRMWYSPENENGNLNGEILMWALGRGTLSGLSLVRSVIAAVACCPFKFIWACCDRYGLICCGSDNSTAPLLLPNNNSGLAVVSATDDSLMGISIGRNRATTDQI